MASLDDPGEVREGFLCPLCLKDLQSFYQLQSHYEEEHSSEDRDVRGQIKSLVQKAKKAKNKLLKREDDRSESGTQGYESFSYGGVDPYMWEPQELGAARSHLSDFKKHRAARIDHYVVEVNKLIIRLEKKLRICMEKVDQKAPEYIKMAASLNAGETTYSLEHANDLRVEVQKMYELIDALSKKILTLGLNQEPQPHPRALQLQRMIRYSATLFVQEKLLGLMSLPTKEQYEELKKKRKQEIERKLIMERQAALELQRRSEERQKELVSRGTVNGEETFVQRGTVRKAEGWLPMSSGPGQSEESDPLLQQIHNITSFIKQARAASRVDEVRMLQENLRQLQDEYDQQQTEKAIELSRRQAEEEDLQREQLQVLREKEWEREQSQVISQHSRTHSVDFRDKLFQQESGVEPQNQIAHVLDLGPSLVRNNVALKSPSLNLGQEPNKEKPVFSTLGQELLQWNSGVHQNEAASLNPFEEEEVISPGDEGIANPFAEDISHGASSPHSAVPSGKKEYNPFEDEEDEPTGDADGPILNPFEVDELPYQKHPSPPNPGNPFEEPVSTNPFEMDDNETEGEEFIEEELLLQQIDNIKAYIFDAKQCGRLDEVEVLTENLKELKRALVKQKEKTN
ncbi:rabenosyn-5 isoform X2 [Notamacropus eugenii]|uniref:rabenosyn-5 isoform X2 n=1 Tax=Notamacropus eugenii TaxID=9315 RepID=UPI003B67DAD6